jgi:DNA replication protein DnaC
MWGEHAGIVMPVTSRPGNQRGEPVEQWHTYLQDPTIADAILDRLTHNSYRLTLKGESMRKQKTTLAAKTAKVR